jgi:hypothetical protein
MRLNKQSVLNLYIDLNFLIERCCRNMKRYKKDTKRIFLSPPHMGGEELYYVQEAFDSNFNAPLGLMVDTFEREFSQKIGINHGVALSSGTRPCV